MLPEGWDNYDLVQRRNYLNGNEFGGQTEEGTVQRPRVCAMEIWCECFGKPREALKKTDSYEIEAILFKLGGWKRHTGNAQSKLRIPGYGLQKTYIRVTEPHGQ